MFWNPLGKGQIKEEEKSLTCPTAAAFFPADDVGIMQKTSKAAYVTVQGSLTQETGTKLGSLQIRFYSQCGNWAIFQN